MNAQKEAITKCNIQIHRLEKLYLDNKSHFYDVVSYMPLLVTVSHVSSLDYKFCNDAVEDMSNLDKGFIMEKGWSLIKEHIHPENLKYQSRIFEQFRNYDNSRVLTYFQYVRKAGGEDYYWVQTHKKFLDKDTYLSMYYDLSQFGKAAAIMAGYLGKIALSPAAYLKFHTLSRREKEVLKLIASGFTNKQIGERLFVSNLTIKTHRQNIMRKLEARNLTEMIRFSHAMEISEEWQ